MQAAKSVIKDTGKPVLVLKSGRTQEGALAASSHTGSLAGSDDICDAAFEQAGIIRCDDIEQMFNYATALAWREAPKGRRTAIITNAGGPGILASDALESCGLELPTFSAATVKKLKDLLPIEAGLKNPVDMIASANHDTYREVCTVLEDDDNIDAIFVIIVI